MVDVFSQEKRKWLMSRIQKMHTKPEKIVRSLIHRMGYRFRIQRKNLPGNPDIVLPRYNTLIFVNGCFWHGHKNCRKGKRPVTNKAFWNQKIDSNIQRDQANYKKLKAHGWKVLVIWECETKNPVSLCEKLEKTFNGKSEKN
jgi:DNA mismatch endonuclease (patch repair protein)